MGPVTVEELLLLLSEVSSERELTDLISSRPEVLSDEVLGYISELEPHGKAFAATVQLVRGARDDPAGAWAEYEREKTEVEKIGAELGIDAVIGANEAGRFDEAIALVEEAVPKALEAGLILPAGFLEGQRGLALYSRNSDDRAADIELAVECFSRALTTEMDSDQRARVLMQLGLALGERIEGDRGENLETARQTLEEALSELDGSSDPELVGFITSNLAVAYLRREGCGRLANLRAAADYAEQALTVRSPKADAVDWAHTQLNLGDIRNQLLDMGEGDVASVRAVYDDLLAEESRIEERWLLGAAEAALARVDRGELARQENLRVEQASRGEPVDVDDPGDLRLRQSALEHLERARELTAAAPDQRLHGRVLADLAVVHEALGDYPAAIAAAQAAVGILRPTNAPQDCLAASRLLGHLLALDGTWSEAAAAYRDAVESSEISFHGRLETAAREREAENAGQLARFAAFAIAADGQPEEAALVLEGGRTRELRRRLHLENQELEQLDDLPADLRAAFLQTTADLAASSLGPSAAPQGRQLQEVVSAIRDVEGFEDFAKGTRPEELAAAVEPGWPLIYVNPTPYGILLLVVRGEGDLQVESAAVHGVTAQEIFLRLMAGDAMDAADPLTSTDGKSYFAGITAVDGSDLLGALDQVGPWLGINVAQPVADFLHDLEISSATLLLCGPLVTAPLHAAEWREGSETVCLLDQFEIRFAPSAVVASAARRRADQRRDQEPYLVAVADPTQDLDGATPEVELIAERFPAKRRAIAYRAEATTGFLHAEVDAATHLHFASHASGGLLDPAESAIIMADRPLGALELAPLGELQTRLVVISACQSALADVAHVMDEVFSISTAMLAAGSACAVASLWPVNDLATALLMVRFYDRLFDQQLEPPAALRAAQLWLRGLNQTDVDSYLAAHPQLEAAFRRRAAERIPDPARGLPTGGSGAGDRPFAHPFYWAGFIAVGV